MHSLPSQLLCFLNCIFGSYIFMSTFLVYLKTHSGKWHNNLIEKKKQIHTQRHREIFFKGFIYAFLERWDPREKEKEREKYGCVRDTATGSPHPGTSPATQACALGGNQTGNPLVCGPALNPLSHTSLGRILSTVTVSVCF